MSAAKKKVTFYLDQDVLRAVRVRAARGDRRDSEIVERAEHVLPRRLLARRHIGLAEPRQIERYDAVAGRRERLEMLRPHAAVGHACVKKHERGSAAGFVIRKHGCAV